MKHHLHKYRFPERHIRIGPDVPVREARDHDGDLILRFFTREAAEAVNIRLMELLDRWDEP